MKWFKKSEGFRHFALSSSGPQLPTGTVAYELFPGKKMYTNNEAKQDIWKSGWFVMKEDERDSRFFEYCLYVKSYNYTLSFIWAK